MYSTFAGECRFAQAQLTHPNEESMPQDPKSQLAEDAKVDVPRRPYAPPQLRQLGSVRDLTLGSPVGAFMDGLPGGMRSM
jgi:hypothetical protein